MSDVTAFVIETLSGYASDSGDVVTAQTRLDAWAWTASTRSKR